MSDVAGLSVGTLVRITRPYRFPAGSSAAVYFPDGITPAHMLVFCSYHDDDPWKYHTEAYRTPFFMVIGRFRHPDSVFVAWSNPVFAIPAEYFD